MWGLAWCRGFLPRAREILATAIAEYERVERDGPRNSCPRDVFERRLAQMREEILTMDEWCSQCERAADGGRSPDDTLFDIPDTSSSYADSDASD